MPLPRRARLLLAALLAVLLGVLVGVGAAAPATAAESSIRGTVRASDGGSTDGAYVTVYARSAGEWSEYDNTPVEDDGSYWITVPHGEYKVGAHPWDERFLDAAYFDGASTLADADVVSVDGVERGVDITMPAHPAGVVKGRVTGPGGAPVQDGLVTFYVLEQEGSTARWDDYADTWITGGRYGVRLPVGTYRVGFEQWDSGDLANEFYLDAPSVETAQDVVVGDGQVVVIDAELRETGWIAGTVTGSGSPLEGVEVAIIQLEGGSWQSVGHARTDALGRYRVHGPAGTYRVRFRDPRGAYAEQVYGAVRSVDEGVDVRILGLERGTEGIDAELALRGRVTGTVTTEGGEPLRGVLVTLYRDVGTPDAPDWETRGDGWNTTGESGAYALPADPGTYRVRFGPTEEHLGEFYDDAVTVETGRDVVVPAGRDVRVDAALTEKPSASGRVTDAVSGDPVPDIEVSLYRLGDPDDPSSWRPAGTATTDEAGRYRIHSLPGTYRAGFQDRTGVYDRTYYGTTPGSIGSADDVVLDTGTTAGVDVDLSGGSAITGTVVTGEHAEAEAYAVVYADVGSPGSPYWTELTRTWGGFNGRFRIPVEPGSYRVGYEAPGRLPSFHGGDSVATASDVVVLEAQRARADGSTGPLSDLTPFRRYEPPEITGIPRVGGSLTASTGQWAETPDSFTFAWLVGDRHVAGAMGPTFVPRAADVGKSVRVLVTALGRGHLPTVYGSGSVGPVGPEGGPVRNLERPTITGSLRPGATLVASPGRWSRTATYDYQWLADNVMISGATSRTLVLGPRQVGRHLTVRVVATGIGEPVVWGSARSARSERVMTPPRISLTARVVGDTVTLVVRAAPVGVPSLIGALVVRRGSRVVSDTRLRGRRTTVRLPRQPKGAWTYTVRYSGVEPVLSGRASVRVVVRARGKRARDVSE